MSDFKPDLFINIEHVVAAGKATFDTNVKRKELSGLIVDFLQCEIGTGADPNKAIDREKYKIRIEVDLSDDTFRCSSDCGNKGLRAGILMACVKQLEDEKEKASEPNHCCVGRPDDPQGA
jgi:hypothetical protein